ncbi:carbohydrate ABC transporter permease [Paenibacillus sp. 1P07SE]|uniref:carbohydrate ABC transporter permease n=1 Tax=Paenibacillus sp. 1P07SE TaxID=3132209 RepID=UPI0039A662B1
MRQRLRHHPFLLLLPVLLLFAVFIIYPLIQGVRISMTDWNGYSQQYNEVGWRNYGRLLTDGRIHTAFVNTLIYGVGSTILQNIWGLGLAVLLNTAFAGRHAARAAIYLPVMISGLIMGYLWYFMLQYDGGALNDVLLAMGREPVDWLASGTRAVYIILFVTSLQYVGQAMIIYLAGLQSIPRMYTEAASIDGASRMQTFGRVTLPLLAPAIITNVTLKLIGGLQIFDVVIALTGGGPGYRSHSLSTMINYLYFDNQNAGYSAALGVMLFLLILLATIAVNRILIKREVEY